MGILKGIAEREVRIDGVIRPGQMRYGKHAAHSFTEQRMLQEVAGDLRVTPASIQNYFDHARKLFKRLQKADFASPREANEDLPNGGGKKFLSLLLGTRTKETLKATEIEAGDVQRDAIKGVKTTRNGAKRAAPQPNATQPPSRKKNKPSGNKGHQELVEEAAFLVAKANVGDQREFPKRCALCSGSIMFSMQTGKFYCGSKEKHQSGKTWAHQFSRGVIESGVLKNTSFHNLHKERVPQSPLLEAPDVPAPVPPQVTPNAPGHIEPIERAKAFFQGLGLGEPGNLNILQLLSRCEELLGISADGKGLGQRMQALDREVN